ncbi:RHS repeat-associated core domain-containing protein [Pseudomonas sp. DCB_AW]|uniref:RHS repeat-associated core domain-containing protein n=1 Tax=Pseudomonas sp. DCB_AW TaxID=2993596 RepID=UPI002248EE94|nr:RHS repeat-associated core domain-containing protein [Pseudomonas sp. DCB_AW]MCX2686560.1 RHS repeat-associated core domain-containing protein [Pseudomonas sp. DCB_AW]
MSSNVMLTALKSSGKAPRTTLLACDEQRSVLLEFSSEKRRAGLYTVYGLEANLHATLGFTGEARARLPAGYLLGNGYRLFINGLMRFSSPDSLSPFSIGGLNAYAYCNGDPVNNSDPTGHMLSPKRPKIAQSHAFLSENGPEHLLEISKTVIEYAYTVGTEYAHTVSTGPNLRDYNRVMTKKHGEVFVSFRDIEASKSYKNLMRSNVITDEMFKIWVGLPKFDNRKKYDFSHLYPDVTTQQYVRMKRTLNNANAILIRKGKFIRGTEFQPSSIHASAAIDTTLR